MNKDSLLNILLSLMKNASSCPCFNSLSENDFDQLLEIAVLNKAIPYLSHFLDCQKCRQKINFKAFKKLKNLYFISFARLMIQEKEKKNLGKTFMQKGVKVIILKDFSSYKKLYQNSVFIFASDIDLLARKKDFKQTETIIKSLGYSLKENLLLKDPQSSDKKNFFYHEKSFISLNQTSLLHLDLHYQIAIASVGEFQPIPKNTVNQLTEDVFKYSRKRDDSFFEPKAEYFLILLIIHYFSSDLCTGLRSLYQIIAFAKFYEKKINWKKFWQTVKDYRLEKIVIFALLLGNRVFGIGLPTEFKKQVKIPLNLKALALKKSLRNICLFPPNTEWSQKPISLKKITEEDYFFRLFLTPGIQPKRLIRPKIIAFWLSLLPKMFFIRFLEILNHRQKLF